MYASPFGHPTAQLSTLDLIARARATAEEPYVEREAAGRRAGRPGGGMISLLAALAVKACG